MYLPPTRAPAGINEAMKLHWVVETGNAVVELLLKMCITGPDQPMQVPSF